MRIKLNDGRRMAGPNGNYGPGEEWRIAIVEDGKLAELYADRFDTASHVGNIYVGKVTNVEPAIPRKKPNSRSSPVQATSLARQ